MKDEVDSSPEPGPSAPIYPPRIVEPRNGGAEDVQGAREEEDEDEVGPMPPTNGEKRKAQSDPEDDESDDEDEDAEATGEDVDQVPISHEIVLKDHKKVCPTLEYCH